MTAVLTSGAHAKRAGSSAISFAAHRRELGTIAVSIPFFAYTACFLLAPTVIVIVGAFQSADGSFTVANFNKLFEANTIAAFGTSILVSVASAVIGAIVGALASYALVIGSKPNGLLRRMISAISSVLAQFGGVMLAFAFIATIGINGVGTMLIKQLTGYVVNPNWLSSLPGLITIYCYFQIPLMIIIFLPAVDSIRPQWREATESLGGNTFQYWTRVAGPILASRFISAFLLLFASAFSAYATAAALPLTIPAIVLVVGLGPIYRWLSADVLSTNAIWLCFAYVVLVMPFAFRALAVGLNSIDVKTLCEASRSLGASWPRVFFRVLIPNLWQSILSASFISIAVVLGEYTVASLLGRMNLQVALYQLGQSNSQISTAMSLLALLFGVILLVALDLISGAMRRNKEGDNS